MILCVKHIDIEGPGTLGSYLKKNGYNVKIIDLQAGDRLPKTTLDLEAVIILGGPMNVYQEEEYPYLKDEDAFIKKLLEKEIPMLGVCLGSQLLAKACGAKVKKAEQKEVGFFPVELTKKGKEDPLLRGLAGTVDVYQWHEDTFDIPKGGELLMTAKTCQNQAFKVGNCAYGLQFHIEITDESIRQWSDEYIKEHQTCQSMQKDMLDTYFRNKVTFDKNATRVYQNFKEIIESRKAIIK